MELLQKFRSGKCTPEEEERIEQWFQSFDAEALPDSRQYTVAANDAAEKTMQALFAKPAYRIGNRFAFMRVAAMVLLVAGSALLSYRFLFNKQEKITYSQVVTPRGARKQVTLPDGSVVTVNAQSRLQIPADFGKKQRHIYLDGEAFFDVKSDASHPFIVHSGQLQTTVLGTSFNVKAYSGEKDIAVAVVTGKVKVDKQAADVHTSLHAGITSNQVLQYNTVNGAAAMRNEDCSLLSGWTNNVYYFENASVTQIAAALERQFDVHITLKSAPRSNCRYTLQLKNETIQHALELLSQLSGITYHIKGKEIIINPVNCW